MLNVLQHADIGNTVAVVTRYFGGTKLGAGGLVRAYTRSVSEALKSAKLTLVQITVPGTLCLPYSQLDSFEHWLQSTNITIADRQFDEAVTLTLQIPVDEVRQVREKTAHSGAEFNCESESP